MVRQSTAYPTGVETIVPPRKADANEAFAEFLLDLRQQMSRIAQQTFDASHPVDEYQSGPGVPAGLSIEVQPTYDKFSERIEYVVISVGTTATGVVLQLGDRFIPITFPSATVGLVAFDCGFVLKSHERRLLTATSWGNTNGFFVGLFGHASDVFETV
jgi:hypothetical protein